MTACVLGFDVGARRIGVAVGSMLSGAAREVAVIDVHDGRIDWPRIERLLRDWQPHRLLVGDPQTLDGGDQPARQVAHRFAREAAERFALPVALIDERRSSIEAAQRFATARARGQKRRRDAQHLDAIAAAVIVERWLQEPELAQPLE